MNLFSKETYTERRKKLKSLLKTGKYLFFGNIESPMNYTDNCYRFRQDSSFLYFFGLNRPHLLAYIDVDADTEIIFGDEFNIDDTIWMGKQESIASQAEKVGISRVLARKEVHNYISKNTQFLPLYRPENKIELAEWLAVSIKSLEASESFTKAVIAIRSIKESQEITAMNRAVEISMAMHMAAKDSLQAGQYEYQVCAEVLSAMAAAHAELAYPIICTKNGQYLHNHYHGNVLKNGDLLLLDTGAEMDLGYAGDLTRTFSVGNKMSTQQQEIYDIVMLMKSRVIQHLKPGLKYIDMHLLASRTMLDCLKQLNLVSGDTEILLDLGVAGMFMPHGLGHMIGLDVHDMEDLGENWVGYEQGQSRSTQMGLKSLRLAKTLTSGHCLTVEPGIYFIPDLMEKFKQNADINEFVNFKALEAYSNFGGIRLEDNVHITEKSHAVLGKSDLLL
jgi:Xaa-Pro aminopeptidase